jgi:cell division protein ZapA
MSPNQVKVNIFGSEYVLKAEGNHAYIKNIANYVDKKMREIDRSQKINASVKVAILAALNIADELFQEKEYRDRLIDQINEDSRSLNRRLEEAIDL